MKIKMNLGYLRRFFGQWRKDMQIKIMFFHGLFAANREVIRISIMALRTPSWPLYKSKYQRNYCTFNGTRSTIKDIWWKCIMPVRANREKYSWRPTQIKGTSKGTTAQPLHQVNRDIFSSSVQPIKGYNYAIILIDCNAGYTCIYGMKLTSGGKPV